MNIDKIIDSMVEYIDINYSVSMEPLKVEKDVDLADILREKLTIHDKTIVQNNNM